jgi:site-specific recombinase XerD
MKTGQSSTLGTALRDFFCNYLPQLRGMSPHTILSYRDSLKLLLQFLAQQRNVSVSDLIIENIGTAEVIAFLNHLEVDRHNGIGTRNSRLSAIHSFFRYVAGISPEHLEQSQRILSIPFKHTTTRTIEYLEFEEIMVVLQVIDRHKPDGRRDYALLALMFNTGARVQEIVDLKANDLQLSNPFSVRIFGKGRKERTCPIWPETAHVLREYVDERGIDVRKPITLFSNHLGNPLTRFGVRYILAKYLRNAAEMQPSLAKKRLHPHSMRHSTAVHLLKSGVDLSTIAHWLGHASINTTGKYAAIDLEMKRQAIAKAKPLGNENTPRSSWRKSPDILDWLESL